MIAIIWKGGLDLADHRHGHGGALAELRHPLAQRRYDDFPADDHAGRQGEQQVVVPLHQQHQRHGDHELVGHGIEEGAERRHLPRRRAR
jgi:hypothetical protein